MGRAPSVSTLTSWLWYPGLNTPPNTHHMTNYQVGNRCLIKASNLGWKDLYGVPPGGRGQHHDLLPQKPWWHYCNVRAHLPTKPRYNYLTNNFILSFLKILFVYCVHHIFYSAFGGRSLSVCFGCWSTAPSNCE